MSNWFEELFGFTEWDYETTRSLLKVEDSHLVSLVNGARYGIGRLDVVSLAELERAVGPSQRSSGGFRLKSELGDVRTRLADPANDGAVFQVASQFNLLEMVDPSITPEDGVTIYEDDPTQGPACAIAAGAATVYRNYFADVDGAIGQTATRQIDTLRAFGDAIAASQKVDVGDLWTMQNGYALGTPDGVARIASALRSVSDDRRNELRGLIGVGIHRDIEITSPRLDAPHTVTQVFTSALPISYTEVPTSAWEPFARLVLEAAYRSTFLVAAQNASLGRSNRVFLTVVGGGAFGHAIEWIVDAIGESLDIANTFNLDVRIIEYGRRNGQIQKLIQRFS